MSTSRLDAVYRRILLTKFFTKGWGKPENLRRLFEFRKVVSNRDECFKLVERDYPVTITKQETLSDCKLYEGYFITPLERYLPGIVPNIARKAHFQALLPLHWPEKNCKPVCLHLAGTGDHFFWRRRNLMVKPLLKEAGIGGIILENPFYGLRKPTDQVRSSLHNVSDIFVMGGCLILESLVLFHWCERNGLGPLGVTGLSMGGHMASLAATNWPKPLVLVPCLSWSTASAVFLQGVMSNSINWDLLEDQYLSDGEYREKLSKMVTIVDEAFLAGKKFARTYSETIKIPPPTEKTSETDKKLDITYKENSANPNQSIIDVNRNVLEHEVPKNTVKSETITEIENLHNELKKLLNENKISVELYKKLISNEKFVLEPEDINYINNLSENRVKEVLLKCKVAGLQELLQTLQKQAEDKAAANDHIDQCVSQNSELMDSPKPTVDSQKPTMDNTKPTMDSLKPTMDSLKPTIDSSKPTVDSSKPTVDSSKANKELIKVVEAPKKVIIRKDKSWNISDFTSDLWLSLPFLKSIAKSGKKIDITKIHWRDRETLQFMRGIMDECTHLSNFSVPFDTSLIIAVCAKHDAYVPRDDVGTLEEIWPGAEVRYVDAGHVSAYILHQSLFRACIKEAFERSKKRWHNGAHIY